MLRPYIYIALLSVMTACVIAVVLEVTQLPTVVKSWEYQTCLYVITPSGLKDDCSELPIKYTIEWRE